MKIVVTVTDVGSVVHAGGSAESRSAIIEIPDSSVPEIVKQYFKSKKWASEEKNRHCYKDLSFSLLEEVEG